MKFRKHQKKLSGTVKCNVVGRKERGKKARNNDECLLDGLLLCVSSIIPDLRTLVHRFFVRAKLSFPFS